MGTFSCIKQAIVEAPTLYNPYFKRDFLLYTFIYDTSLFAVLTQNDDQNNERPISFMSDSLQGPELNFPAIDKKAYVVKHFQPCLLKNHCIIFVPHSTIRSLFVQQELGERRVNYMIGL